MAAAVTATLELLTEQGPRTLSVRRIAERAGVNHALLHRHFGTKDEIVRQALATRSAEVARDIAARAARAARAACAGPGGHADPGTTTHDADHDGGLRVAEVLEVLAGHPAYWTTLARVALDAPELAGQGTAATTELFSAALDEQGVAAGDAATAACLVLGWRVFGAFVVGATGATPEDLDQSASTLLRTLLRTGDTPPYH